MKSKPKVLDLLQQHADELQEAREHAEFVAHVNTDEAKVFQAIVLMNVVKAVSKLIQMRKLENIAFLFWNAMLTAGLIYLLFRR